MKNIAVIGLGFGDEGKGMVTNWLCLHHKNSLVVRYSGGHQAGHTVYKYENKHVFSNFGSGTLQSIPTYWSMYCTVDPVGLIHELEILIKTFPRLKVKLFINKKCPITTPYDKIYNQNIELINNHGSVGVGFGATIEREVNHYSLLVEDLLHPKILKIKLDGIKKYYSIELDEFKIKEFIDCCELITDNGRNITIVDKIPEYEINIFEGSQGLLLDQNIGFFPNVTRSSVGYKRLKEFGEIDDIYYVTRAYQTRHGNGVMTYQDINSHITDNPFETNVFNGSQGYFRKSILDLDLLSYSIMKDNANAKIKNIIITCLDQLSELRFIFDGIEFKYSDKISFGNAIKDKLNIKNAFISESPYSENISII